MNTPDTDIEVAAVPDLINAHAKILTDRGYELEERTTVPRKREPDEVVAVFFNPRTGRRVRIGIFLPPRTSQEPWSSSSPLMVRGNSFSPIT
jgi:hypothetical protein